MSKEVDIERVMLQALLEASEGTFFGRRAQKLLNIRSEINQKRLEFAENYPHLMDKLEDACNYLTEAERILGDFSDLEPSTEYTPMRQSRIKKLMKGEDE